jgi:hypothetical protein
MVMDKDKKSPDIPSLSQFSNYIKTFYLMHSQEDLFCGCLKVTARSLHTIVDCGVRAGEEKKSSVL